MGRTRFRPRQAHAPLAVRRGEARTASGSLLARGGEWSGRSLMCTKDREFTIRGVEDCLARGLDRNGFYEVDTGEQKSWTIQLTDPNQPVAPTP